MNIFNEIKQWNDKRGLINRGFCQEDEVSFIIEELIEGTEHNRDTRQNDEMIKLVTQIILRNGESFDKIRLIDSFADIIVFATGAILKLGHDPQKVMEEVLKELNARTGEVINGKFEKSVGGKKYTADFTNTQS